MTRKRTYTPEQKKIRSERANKWNKEHREEKSEYDKEWFRNISLEKKREYARKHEICRKERRTKIKLEVYSHYGGNKCACCGETHVEFLTIDHIDGGGTQHRKELRGKDILFWLRDNNYPKGFQILCMNCNFARRYGNSCPHEKEKT